MKLTVLINNYNYAKYLKSTIESVLAQSRGDFELLVVDDGSTDDSREIIRSFRDPRVVPIFKENGGQGSAFKAGISRATGEYIAFLDSDDLWDPNKLERCAEVLRSESDIVLLNHSYRDIDASGVVLGVPQRFPKTGRYDMMADLRKLETRLSLVPTSFFLARRLECQKLRFDSEKWKIGADTPVAVGLGMAGRIYNLDEPLGSYRNHNNNLWHGRYDDEVLFRHFQKMYSFINDEMIRYGRKERFDFSKSSLALDHAILQTYKYSPQGIYCRLRKLLRRLRHGLAASWRK